MEFIDRSKSDHARWIIEWMLPDPLIRSACLMYLAESIETAHSSRRSSWGITLFRGFVRLNIGMPEAFSFSQERIFLVLDSENCPDEIWKIPGVTRYVYDLSTPNQLFRSVPDGIGCTFPPKLISEIYPVAKQSHVSLINKSVRTRRNPSTKLGHSPGILEYLRVELEKDIPNPLYPPPTSYIYAIPQGDALSHIKQELADRDWSIYHNN